nr:MAG TPA: hypothetical protein [Caudoviricetes sp.]
MIAAAAIPDNAVAVPAIVVVAAFSPFAVMLPNLDNPFSIPEESRSVSITTFPSANLLHLPCCYAK